MKKSPSVAVGIVTRSRDKTLIDLLEDLSSQSQLPKEVIVVENTYDQSLLSQEIIEKKIPSSVKVTYMSMPLKNMSPAKPRNACLSNITSDILMFLDDDVRVESSYIKDTVKWFQKLPDAVAIVPKINSTTDDIWSKFSEAFFSVGQHSALKKTFRESFPTCACSLDFHEIKKTRVLFDEKLLGGEDYLFSKQVLSVSNKKSIFVPQLNVSHAFRMQNSFQDFIKRFNWYSRSAFTLKNSYPDVFKYDLKYIEDMIPKRKMQLLFFPFFLLKNIIFESISSYHRYNLNRNLLIPNIIYNLIITYNLWTDKGFLDYLKSKIKKIIKQKTLLFR